MHDRNGLTEDYTRGIAITNIDMLYVVTRFALLIIDDAVPVANRLNYVTGSPDLFPCLRSSLGA